MSDRAAPIPQTRTAAATAAVPAGATAPGTSRTLRELTRRTLLLLVLVVLATGTLFQAYRGVHSDAVPLKSAGAPGVLAVDTAKDALIEAQKDIDLNDGSTGDFHTRLSVANLSLARAAGGADVAGRQTIQTVTGLIATYSGWIEDAEAQPAMSPLRQAYLSYAVSTLGIEVTGPAADATVMGRLAALHAEQEQSVRRQTDFGPLLWLEWSVALALALALLLLLAEAHRFSGARFRRQLNVPLLAACVLLVAGVAVLVAFTALTHAAMADARTALARPLAGNAIPRAGAQVSGRLADTGFRAAVTGWIPVGGLLLALLVLLGLQPRTNEYRVGAVTLKWPRLRTVGIVATCLVVLAGGGAIVFRATGWQGSVTLLANWTGTEQERFQQQVIDKFEDEYRIHVVYQGSSAESQVLAADVESGTPPDVAILPGPGELAGYAAEGLLTPLDDLVAEGDFASTWVTPVKGTDGKEHTYWLPMKTDLKSMVWHPKDLDAAGVAQAARTPASWCLGMGSDATSGWPGSDWIEDILLQQTDKATYDSWVSGGLSWQHDPRVRRAWTTWGDMVGAGRPDLTPARLTTPFGHAADGVAMKPPTCRLEHQSSIAQGSDGWKAAGAAYVHSADVIPGAVARNSWEVSGDLAAVLHSTPQSAKLIAYLASDEAQRAWAGTRSGFSVKGSVLDGYPDTGMTGTLRDPTALRCYDASDAMPAEVRDAFALAVLRFLADPESLDDQLAILDKIKERTGRSPLTSVCSSH
ncbi:extracellular solute-binding protein [Streptomyces cocklensis]|uniref:ABC-type glycerol-3-phosphate transport system, substrate-binding protein n=1 Tax=Actinacidiphila cocklensis TaxID=887465 RepID=A0A9W4DMP6_9ACTN|nr:extracellular solute-binding protein [Actinacidiphila cocklensis]MDD1057970.1 extracellular solute-binding protein [Actinacidiphila cocklensis]WSX74348.1 extracellular solute-binding protein [Streptomyces sp. NBC_00899]WSX79587.1 extracellular solute-binding protein [Streptomyces sp. NBC_00899]CAG6392979.1 ABC-type glycerol-3-phosphate transport system, substrate-binding protein [Actinacidiphila cocklensis]